MASGRLLVEARGLTKTYPARNGTPPFCAVNGIDFEFGRGEAFGFLGPNGAGKSSTMRMLGAISPATAGTLRVLGMDPAQDGPKIRARIGVVPQDDCLDRELTVRENIYVYGRYFGLGKSKTAGVLGGGTLAAVSPKSSPAQIAAAMKWISFYYLEPLIKNKQPVGVPELPVFNQALYARSQKWIKPYINVPESQFAPFNNGIFKEHVIPEPESATQAIYGDLDSTVQAVFANQDANPSQLLAAANSAGQASIASGG